MIFWIALGLVTLVLIVWALHVKFRRREEAQIVDDFAPEVEQQVRQTLRLLNVPAEALQTRDVAKTWGHEVLVFGFRLADAPEITAEEFHKALPAEYALTDFWYRDGALFIEVALLRNKATQEYVDDIYKANQKS